MISAIIFALFLYNLNHGAYCCIDSNENDVTFKYDTSMAKNEMKVVINTIAVGNNIHNLEDDTQNSDELEAELLQEVKKLYSVDDVPKEATECFKKMVKRLNSQYKSFSYENLSVRRLKYFKRFAHDVQEAMENQEVLTNNANVWKVAAHIVNMEPTKSSELKRHQKLLILLSETIYKLKLYINLRKTKKDFKEICELLNKPPPTFW
ncbi:uncharacterized protein LOC116348120 isoform X1 [Contarinia nasturtii]|uniref:uncharacterized protein LOC116348120 isoform X1 n=1 Tax=Contarinia nasturtii TaxID=265458 RepID=UPI0012D47199|nr:uncharacterized protein LOC116348120 isoform X1 [Contarinia nasturtii]